jgi:hypothetical protein
MKCVSRIVLLAASLAAMGGTALAEPEPGDAEPDGDGEAKPPEGDAKPKGDEQPPDDDDTGVITKASWPKAAIERPLVAAKSMFELSPLLTIEVATSDTEKFSVAGRYGISDKLELLFQYGGTEENDGVRLRPNPEFKGTIAAGIGFSAIKGAAGGKFDLAAKAGLAYNLLGKSMAIVLGPDMRYKVTPKWFFGTPQNVPGLVATVVGIGTGAAETSPIFYNIPLAVGFQALPNLQVQAITSLVTIAFSDADNVSIADKTVVKLDAIYALNNALDARLQIDFGDIQAFGDLFGFTFGVNVRL